jgi:hypothetical protein
MPTFAAVRLLALLALLGLGACEDMFSLTPYKQVAVLDVATDMRKADALFRRLAQQNGMELHGGLYGQPEAVSPITDATITSAHCLLLAEKRGAMLRLSLSAVEGESCPEQMHVIFHQARRALTAPPRSLQVSS